MGRRDTSEKPDHLDKLNAALVFVVLCSASFFRLIVLHEFEMLLYEKVEMLVCEHYQCLGLSIERKNGKTIFLDSD